MKIDVYLHSSKEDMWHNGRKAGLSEAACELFMFACCEVKVTLDVNPKNGRADIIAIDDRKIAP